MGGRGQSEGKAYNAMTTMGSVAPQARTITPPPANNPYTDMSYDGIARAMRQNRNARRWAKNTVKNEEMVASLDKKFEQMKEAVPFILQFGRNT